MNVKSFPLNVVIFIKKLKQKYTLENIEAHQTILEKRYKSLEKEGENKLRLFFPGDKYALVIALIENTVGRILGKKQFHDQTRIDNLILDHKHEKHCKSLEILEREL